MITINVDSYYWLHVNDEILGLNNENLGLIQDIFYSEIDLNNIWPEEYFKFPPIYTVNPYTFDSWTSGLPDYQRPENAWAVERLAFYTRTNQFIFNKTPVIVVCPERIRGLCDSDEDFYLLYAKVIVHELAHALMDMRGENAFYGIKGSYFHWLEEAMANLITITKFACWSGLEEEYDYPGFTIDIEYVLNYVISTIERQPSNYQLGLDLNIIFIELDINVADVVRSWCDFKASLTAGNRDQRLINHQVDWMDKIDNEYLNLGLGPESIRALNAFRLFLTQNYPVQN